MSEIKGISKEEWNEWLVSPFAKIFKSKVIEICEEVKKELITKTEFLEIYRTQGRIRGLIEVINMFEIN